MIYGPLALGFPIDDPVLQDACYAAWNDWAVEEFNAVAPDRLCVLAFLPGHSAEAAAAELQRSAGLGHRGAIVDVFDVDIGDRSWDRLWAAAADTGLPISFHIKDGSWSGFSYQMGKWQSAAFATILPLQHDEALATMVFCGALERNPGCTLVLAESGIGWLPYFLARMDLEWEALNDKLSDPIRTRPSELFRRQVMATFEEDALAAQLIPLLGADSCMWASDYPHTDSTFPNSLPAIEETLGVLPTDDRQQDHRDELRPALRLCRCLLTGWARSAASTTCRFRCSTPTTWSRSTARWASRWRRTLTWCRSTSATR